MPRFSSMIFFLLIGLLLVGVVIVPGTRKIFVLIQEQRMFAEANAELQDIMTSRDRLRAEYRAISESHIAKLNLLLPEKLEIGVLLSIYESVAKRNGLSLVSIDFGAGAQTRPGGAQAARQGGAASQIQPGIKPPESGAVPLVVTQNLRGSYGAFRNYLRDIEFLLNLTDITDISFNPANLQDANFSVQGTTYYFAK